MIKINIGAGKTNFGKDWIHVDLANFPHIDEHHESLPFHADNSVDLIYSSHMIEYLDRTEIVPLLQDWYRVLKPGGILRLAVPDWQKLIFIYSHKGGRLKDILGPLYGRMNVDGQNIYHKTVYDYEDLFDLLKSVGFKNVREYDWKTTSHFMIDDCSRAHYPHRPQNIETGIFDKDQMLISLNVEGTK